MTESVGLYPMTGVGHNLRCRPRIPSLPATPRTKDQATSHPRGGGDTLSVCRLRVTAVNFPTGHVVCTMGEPSVPSVIYHVVQLSVWNEAEAAGKEYFPPTYAQDGMSERSGVRTSQPSQLYTAFQAVHTTTCKPRTWLGLNHLIFEPTAAHTTVLRGGHSSPSCHSPRDSRRSASPRRAQPFLRGGPG